MEEVEKCLWINAHSNMNTSAFWRLSGLTAEEFYEQHLKRFREAIIADGLSLYIVHKESGEIACTHLPIDYVQPEEKAAKD